MVPRERPRRARAARRICASTAPTTTACCSGRIATTDTYFGLPLVADRAVLVPTAEEDPLIHVDALERVLRAAAGFLFLTPEEADAGRRARAGAHAVGDHRLRARSGRPSARRVAARRAAASSDPFVLYLGPHRSEQRLRHADPPFPCATSGSAADVQLVMAGPASMPIPDHPSIRALGFVDDDVREALLDDARRRW